MVLFVAFSNYAMISEFKNYYTFIISQKSDSHNMKKMTLVLETISFSMELSKYLNDIYS